MGQKASKVKRVPDQFVDDKSTNVVIPPKEILPIQNFVLFDRVVIQVIELNLENFFSRLEYLTTYIRI